MLYKKLLKYNINFKSVVAFLRETEKSPQFYILEAIPLISRNEQHCSSLNCRSSPHHRLAGISTGNQFQFPSSRRRYNGASRQDH